MKLRNALARCPRGLAFHREGPSHRQDDPCDRAAADEDQPVERLYPKFAAIASMAARSSALTVSSESRWPVLVAPRGEHRKRIRSTNLLERSFVEVRRRTKVFGRFPRRDLGALPDLGRARALLAQLARRRDDAARGFRDPPVPTEEAATLITA